MTNYLWLVWYRAQSPMGPKHWSLFVTYDTDEEALGTIYQVRAIDLGDRVFPKADGVAPPPLQMEGTGWGTGQFNFRICRGVQLKGARGSQAYESRLLLGAISDGLATMLHEYGAAAADMINEQNGARFVGESNCQDWALLLIKSLEDGRFIPAGTLEKATACPRR